MGYPEGLSQGLIQQVAKNKRRSREWEESIRKEMLVTEKQYVENPTLEKQRRWLNKQQEYEIAVTRKGENKRLFQKQCAFGEGGHMLALLVKTNTSPSAILAVRMLEGEISPQTPVIIDTFRQYYANLYKSRWEEEAGEMDNFFRRIAVPALSERNRSKMEAPITRGFAAGSSQDG